MADQAAALKNVVMAYAELDSSDSRTLRPLSILVAKNCDLSPEAIKEAMELGEKMRAEYIDSIGLRAEPKDYEWFLNYCRRNANA